MKNENKQDKYLITQGEIMLERISMKYIKIAMLNLAFAQIQAYTRL